MKFFGFASREEGRGVSVGSSSIRVHQRAKKKKGDRPSFGDVDEGERGDWKRRSRDRWHDVCKQEGGGGTRERKM